MVRALPSHPSLEHLKGQAKALLAALQCGDERAQRRFERWFGPDPAPFRLTQAQLVIAREQGFSSWRQLAAWVTGRTLPGAPSALVELLGARTAHVRRAAAEALAALGQDGVTAAIEGLSHRNPHVRRGAADFMDHHADDRCVPQLVDLALHDPEPRVRGMAMHALGCQRCKPQPLTLDMASLQMEVARHDPEWKARRGAVWWMGQFNADPRVKDALRSVAEYDPHPEVRRAARAGLARTQPGPAHRAGAALRVRQGALAQAG